MIQVKRTCRSKPNRVNASGRNGPHGIKSHASRDLNFTSRVHPGNGIPPRHRLRLSNSTRVTSVDDARGGN